MLKNLTTHLKHYQFFAPCRCQKSRVKERFILTTNLKYYLILIQKTIPKKN